DPALRRNNFRGLTHADLIDIAGHNFGALTREFDRGGPPYSAARAGDRHQHIAERFARLAHLRTPHRPAGRPALGYVDHFGDRAGQHLRMRERRPVAGLDVAAPKSGHPAGFVVVTVRADPPILGVDDDLHRHVDVVVSPD